MAYGDSSYSIKFNTTADTGGLDKTKEGIQSLTEATHRQSASDEVALEIKKRVTEQDRVDAEIKKTLDQATGKLGDTVQDTGNKELQAAKETTLGYREKREALSALAAQVGGLPELGLWLSPELAALAATLASIEAVKKVLEGLSAPVEAFNAALQSLQTARLTAAADAASSLSDSLSEVARNETTLQAVYQRGNSEMDERIKKFGEERDGILKVQEAEEKAFEADLDHQVQLSKITKEAAEEKKEAARLALDHARGATDASKLQFEIDQRTNQFQNADLRIRGGGDRNAIIAAEANQAKAHTKATAADTALKNEQAAPFNAEIDGQTEEFSSLEAARTRSADFRDKGQANEEMGDNIGAAYFRKEADELDKSIKARQSYIDNLAKEADATKQAEAAAKNLTDQAKEQAKQDQTTRQNGAAQIQSLQDQLRIQNQTTQGVEGANTRAIQSGQDSRHFQQLQDRVNNGTATPQEHQEYAAARAAGNIPPSQADLAAQNAAAQTPANRIDINQAMAALGTLRSQTTMGQAHDPQIAALLNEFIGLARDLHLNTAQRSSFDQLAREVTDLRRQVQIHDQLHQTQTTLR